MIEIYLSKIAETDVSFIETYYPRDYNLHKMNVPSDISTGVESGEHYKLLTYMSSLFEYEKIFDLGARAGISALCLGFNRRNEVHSYDLKDMNFPFKFNFPNIITHKKNVFDEDPSKFMESPLIFLDIDPHDGIQEPRFFHILRKNNYKGLVILDDISTTKLKLFPAMEIFWESIDEEKYDLTNYGHGSGTGLVNFGMELKVI